MRALVNSVQTAAAARMGRTLPVGYGMKEMA